MDLLVEDHDLGGGGVEAYFTMRSRPAVAIQRGLPPEAREARRLEALGYLRNPPDEGKKWCFRVEKFDEVDVSCVDALKAVLEEQKPQWLKRVRDGLGSADNLEMVGAVTGLPLQVVKACLSLLENRSVSDREAGSQDTNAPSGTGYLKVVDSKIYNTDTAEVLHAWHNGRNLNDFKWVEETLYRTRKGAFFVVGSGGAATDYRKRVDSNSWTSGTDLRPLSREEAIGWLQTREGEDALVEFLGNYLEEA